MFEKIENLPDGVVGFEAVGKLTASDYEKTLIPAVDAALATGGKLRFLYLAGTRFEGFELGAAWDDMSWGFRHAFDFDKVAFVSDHAFLTAAVRPMAMFMPSKIKVFPVKDLDAAKAWLAE